MDRATIGFQALKNFTLERTEFFHDIMNRWRAWQKMDRAGMITYDDVGMILYDVFVNNIESICRRAATEYCKLYAKKLGRRFLVSRDDIHFAAQSIYYDFESGTAKEWECFDE